MENILSTETPLAESNGTSVTYYDLYPDVYTGVLHEGTNYSPYHGTVQ